MTAPTTTLARPSAVAPTPKTKARERERQLIRRASNGDQAAFAILVRETEGRIRGLLLRLTANRVLADDLAQETFLRAYRGLAHFEGRSALSTWLYRIAYNVFLNHRARTKEFVPLPEAGLRQTAAPEGEGSARRRDLRADLDQAIASLPEKYRVVLALCYVRELTYPEIAEMLDVPLGTVKTHIHRAKKQLREHLGARGYG
jgi:RNA polymerase sigma-70 factor (ECF subfamily)